MIWFIIAVLAVVLDQLSKYIIISNVELGKSNSVIDGFFYITNIRNTGAAWSIFQNGRYFFITLTIIISIAMIYYMVKNENKILRLSLSMVLGGAIGNLLDRIFRGSVVDFLEFHFGSYRFPVFNIADSFVVVGTFVLAYYLIFIYEEKNTEEKEEAEQTE